ncbi:MAG: APC family permease [Deltaproteobacteria bacterium]|nr:APC family permease [Deltaproteobacteria bacterium]
MAGTEGEFGLRRVLGLGDLVAIEVGTTIGAGVFSLTALASARTGPSTPLAYLAAAAPIVVLMLVVATLGSALPTVGGAYRYPARLFSPRWAFAGVWCYALGLVLGALPLCATQCAHYLGALWPGLPATPTAAALLTVFWAINLAGVSPAAVAQAVMVVVLVAALLVFGLGGLPTLEAARFTPLFPGGAGGFAIAGCILSFALLGANAVIELGAEVRRPARDIPLSLLISVPLVAALYVLVSISAVGNIDRAAWAAAPDATLAQPAAAFLSRPAFLFFLVGGAFLAFATTLNGIFLWSTRSLLVVAADGLLPAALTRTSRRGVPVAFLTILWALSVLAVLADAGVELFSAYATVGGLVVFAPSMIAALLLRRRAPEAWAGARFRLRGPWASVAPIVGLVTILLLATLLLGDLGLRSLPFLGWLVAGLGFWEWRRRAVERRTGVTTEEAARMDLERMVGAAREGRERATTDGPR